MLLALLIDVLLKHRGGIMCIYTIHLIYAKLCNLKTLYGSKSVVLSLELKTYGKRFS